MNNSQDQRHENWLINMALASRVPEGSRQRQRLTNFKSTDDNQEAITVIMALLDDQLDMPLLLLYGGVGVGKTHLSVAACWEFLEDGHRSLYFQAEELLDAMRCRLGSDRYEMLIDHLRRTDLLVIDDIGTQSDTPWGMAKMNMVVDIRYRERKPLIITANTLDIPDRILDRMREGRTVRINGKSYRPGIPG
ncbi:Chromosomal replication initiator protein DnaA [subsurface metagenome]